MVYLSDLKPTAYDFTPYLRVRWPLVLDGSVDGRDLHLAGGVFDKGLGMHTASRVTYSFRPIASVSRPWSAWTITAAAGAVSACACGSMTRNATLVSRAT